MTAEILILADNTGSLLTLQALESVCRMITARRENGTDSKAANVGFMTTSPNFPHLLDDLPPLT